MSWWLTVISVNKVVALSSDRQYNGHKVLLYCHVAEKTIAFGVWETTVSQFWLSSIPAFTLWKSKSESEGHSGRRSPVPSSTLEIPSSSPGCNSPQSSITHGYMFKRKESIANLGHDANDGNKNSKKAIIGLI